MTGAGARGDVGGDGRGGFQRVRVRRAAERPDLGDEVRPAAGVHVAAFHRVAVLDAEGGGLDGGGDVDEHVALHQDLGAHAGVHRVGVVVVVVVEHVRGAEADAGQPGVVVE